MTNTLLLIISIVSAVIGLMIFFLILRFFANVPDYLERIDIALEK